MAIGRFLRLPHPRTGVLSLFLPLTASLGGSTANTHKILEVQAVEPPNPRSWLIGEQVISDGKLLIMTSVDPTFLLIPILQVLGAESTTFRPPDDLLEEATRKLVEQSMIEQDASLHLSSRDLNIFLALDCSIQALKRICEVKEITEEISIYRYSPSKVVDYLRKKVERLSTAETFELSRTLVRNLAKDGFMDDGKEGLLQVARVRSSCELISQYLPADVYTQLLQSYDFIELDTYLQGLEQEIAPPVPKSGKAGKEKPAATQDGKKRKVAKGSQGVEKLKKVNVSSMPKISSFFAKKA